MEPTLGRKITVVPETIKNNLLNIKFLPIKPLLTKNNPTPIWIEVKILKSGKLAKSINKGWRIIASGMIYKPNPKTRAVLATLNQFSSTILAAIKTPPQTGGVIVDKSANQKINKCTNSGLRPKSISAGPATDTQITYAAVVGTSIPKIRHAIAVRKRANHRLPPDRVIIEDVTFIPNPVIPRTPTISEAQRIIDAIIDTWRPANNDAFTILVFVVFQLKFKFMSKNKRSNPDSIAIAAENWGV